MSNTPAVESAPAVVVSPVVADKAPKAKAAKAKTEAPAKGRVAESLTAVLAYEPGILDLKLTELDARAETNTTRSDVGIDPKHVESIALSIKTAGQLEPITVQRVKGEFAPFRLVSGFHRVAAMRSLGRSTIDARVLVDSSDRALVLGNVGENMSARKEVTALGAAVGVEALLAEGYSMAEVAEFLGNKAEDYVRDLARIAKGAEEVRTALKLGDDHEQGVTWGVARLVLRFPKGEQAALLRRVQKLSVVKAREVLAEYRTGKKAGSEGSDGADEGEGEGSEGAKGSDGKHDVVVPEAKVVKVTVPFLGTYGDVLGAMREALSNEDTEQAQKILNVMAKALAKQEKALRTLLGDKQFEAAEKAAKAAAEE